MSTVLSGAPDTRRARASLEGLSVGDAFGGMCFVFTARGDDHIFGVGGMVARRPQQS